jgi:23S rRNA (cytidine2498-2'-O)-methyltransferase
LGSERDVHDELMLSRLSHEPSTLAPALVVAQGLPKSLDASRDLAFVRQGFCVRDLWTIADLTEKVPLVLGSVLDGIGAYALHVWTPDSPQGNVRATLARSLEEQLGHILSQVKPDVPRVEAQRLSQYNAARLLQVCVVDADRLAVGCDTPSAAISLAHGGRSRTSVEGHLPSRSARKLEEALQWLRTSPGAGEVCVDLGAAPGGWTHVASSHGAKVIAVDLAALQADVAARRSVRVVRQNAFQFTPDEPVDWLFCDMAYRPLEVAALLAKWARQRWARLLVANIKLPMTKKVETLQRVKQLLQEGGWRELRAKQLYHDRDEVTIRGFAT